MRDFGDHSSFSAASKLSPSRKRLGGYLVEAGLLTPAQVDVALNDQKITGMRFGEILAARGWVKQQTIEYLMKKIVLPEQEAANQEQARRTAPKSDSAAIDHTNSTGIASQNRSGIPGNLNGSEPTRQPPARREIPISKPLPSVSSSDGDVSWVG